MKDAPSDFVLFPPAGGEGPEGGARLAVERLQAFVKDRPDSKQRPEAEKLLLAARGRLAAHEWYVADFYLRRRPLGRRGRAAGGAAARTTRAPPASPRRCCCSPRPTGP